MKNTIKYTLASSALALLVACGGGGESTVSQTPDGYQVDSGLAQKGPLLQGSGITINELTQSTMQPNSKSYTFQTVDNSGKFKATGIIFSSPFLETTALGYYFDELTGQTAKDMVYLRGLSNLSQGNDTAVNVNVLSNFTKNRIKNLITKPPVQSFTNARRQAEREILRAFFIYNVSDLLSGKTVAMVREPNNFMELDLSKSREVDQILAAISSLVMQVGKTGEGVNTFITQIETDLADDGVINNSILITPSIEQKITAAIIETNYAAVAANLNSFYKTTTYSSGNISQWLDNSGGVDRVIDRFKFSTSNAEVNMEYKSPDYILGSDDIGQCISVSSGKIYLNGKLSAAEFKASANAKVTIGLTPTLENKTQSEFIQRSPPNAQGVCSSVKTASEVVRLQKFSINKDIEFKISRKIKYYPAPAVIPNSQDPSTVTGDIYVNINRTPMVAMYNSIIKTNLWANNGKAPNSAPLMVVDQKIQDVKIKKYENVILKIASISGGAALFNAGSLGVNLFKITVSPDLPSGLNLSTLSDIVLIDSTTCSACSYNSMDINISGKMPETKRIDPYFIKIEDGLGRIQIFSFYLNSI